MENGFKTKCTLNKAEMVGMKGQKISELDYIPLKNELKLFSDSVVMSLLTSSIEIDDKLSSELVKHSELTHLETLRSGDLERFFRFQNRFDLSDFNFSGIALLLLIPW